MIEAAVTQIDRFGKDMGIIMSRNFNDPNLSLQDVLSKMEKYVKEERINEAGECKINVIFSNLHNTNMRN